VDDADDLHEYLWRQHVEELVDFGVAVECWHDETLAGVAEVGVRSCHLEVSSVKVCMAMFEVSAWVRTITSACQSGSAPILFIAADVECVDLGVNAGVEKVVGSVECLAGHFCCVMWEAENKCFFTQSQKSISIFS